MPKKVVKTPSPEEIIKPVKTFADIVKTYWGYFMTFTAVVTFIWTLGVKSERKTLDNAAIKKDLTELKQEVKKIDTLIIIVSNIQEKQNQIIESQNAMRDSYVLFLANDKTLSKKDFIEYMEGLEFRLKPEPVIQPAPVENTPEYDPKITVKKVK